LVGAMKLPGKRALPVSASPKIGWMPMSPWSVPGELLSKAPDPPHAFSQPFGPPPIALYATQIALYVTYKALYATQIALYATYKALYATQKGLYVTYKALYATQKGLYAAYKALYGAQKGLYAVPNGSSAAAPLLPSTQRRLNLTLKPCLTFRLPGTGKTRTGSPSLGAIPGCVGMVPFLEPQRNI
jgi:hypothetical protein